MKKILFIGFVLCCSFASVCSQIPNDRALQPRTHWFNLLYSTQRVNINTEAPWMNLTLTHNLGFHWHHYSMKTLMAWNITRGDSTTVVGMLDDLV